MSSYFVLLGLFGMTEQRILQDNKIQNKWVKCPTCRQHTDVGNIAYVDDRQSENCDSSLLHTTDGPENWGSSILVQGSYGTKVYFLSANLMKVHLHNSACYLFMNTSLLLHFFPTVSQVQII